MNTGHEVKHSPSLEQLREFTIGVLQRASEAPSERPKRELELDDGPSKWRKAWFTTLIGTLLLCVEQGVITDPEFIKEIYTKRDKWVKDNKFGKQRMVTPEDVREGEIFLAKAMAFFEDKKATD